MTVPITPVEDAPLEGVFNPNDYDWYNHVKVALKDLPPKKLSIDRAMAYYDGDHPKVWLTEDIGTKLDDVLVHNMAENWCDVATDAPIKRLSVQGFVQPKDNSLFVEAAKAVWDDNDLKLEQREIYTTARAYGEAFAFVWKDEEKESGIDITVVDPRRVWWPADSHRSKPSRVVQIWADEEDGVWRATCYYKYVVVRLVGPRLKDGLDSVMPQVRYFEPDSEDPGGEHGFEDVPVIRFALTKKRRGLIDRLKSTQDKINKLAANLLVTAEFNAWRKMIVLTQQHVDENDLIMRPNRVLVLDPGGGDEVAPTSVWEGSATELANFSSEQEKLIDKLFTKADLPGHMQVRTSREVPSGAAYEADEGPFTEAIEDMQESYGESWHDLYDLVLGVDVECQWRNPHVKSDNDEMQTVKAAVEAGVPLALALKYYAGWDDDKLKELEDSPLTPKEQLALAATQALAEGTTPDEAQPTGSGQGNPANNDPASGGQSSGRPSLKP